MKIIKPFLTLLRDTILIKRLGPSLAQKIMGGKFDFAFLIHPRNYSDYLRQFKIAKYLPKKLFTYIISRTGPIIVSKITGLKDENGAKKTGILVSILGTPEILFKDKELSRRKILEAALISSNLGVKVMGLGALTASLTERGVYLASRIKNIGITTGHAYTTLTVVNNLKRVVKKVDIDISSKKTVIAIVGAAGSVGNACLRLLIKNGARKFVLIDKKIDLLEKQISEIKENIDIDYEYSDDVNRILGADIIITATNAPYALVKPHMVSPGAVILDDAEPSDLDPSLSERNDILLINAGLSRLPDINCHFNFFYCYS